MSSYGSKSASKRPAFSYPTQWSEWEWWEESRCYRRWRLNAPNDYDVEYGQAQAPAPAQAKNRDVPRTTQSTSLSSDVQPSQDPVSSYYTHSPPQALPNNPPDSTDTAAQDFAALRIDDAPVASNATETAARNESSTTHIQTSDPRTAAEKFDKNYRVHAEKEFRWGKVFKLLWTEPRGSGQGSHLTEGTYSARHIRKGKHDETHYEKVRRFVIISSRRGHCLCLPINTYSGQGTNKYGVHAEDHAIIYTDKPYYLKGEWEKGMTRDPIRVIPASSRHKLDQASRLNYAKVYTVECNVKVWFIGKIHPDSENKLVADYNRVHPPVMAPSSHHGTSSEDTVAYATGGTSSSYGQGDSSFQMTSASGASVMSTPVATSYYGQGAPSSSYGQSSGSGYHVPPSSYEPPQVSSSYYDPNQGGNSPYYTSASGSSSQPYASTSSSSTHTAHTGAYGQPVRSSYPYTSDTAQPTADSMPYNPPHSGGNAPTQRGSVPYSRSSPQDYDEDDEDDDYDHNRRHKSSGKRHRR